MYYGGESNVPGAPGNVAAVNPGGIPNRPVDPELLKRLQQQGTPPPPGFREQYGLPPAPQPGSAQQASFGSPSMLAGNPSFDINRTPGALGGRSGEQLQRLYEGGTQQNQQLNDELQRRGIMPGSGPQLPMAMGSSQGFPPMGNAGFLASVPQGPYTPLPAPGWNPGMIKPPGDPNFRPSPQMQRIGPTGQPVPWLAAGFQNKFVS